jgi:hypothetical protein
LFGELQASERAVGSALDRLRGRENWLIGGALAGAAIGFVGTVVVSRPGGTHKPDGRDDADIAT